MDNRISESILLNSSEKHQQMLNLMILKLATCWLEKQDWVSTPYDGQNPLQDLIFHAQLTANRIWENFFSRKMDQCSLEELKRQISEIGDLTPELQLFIESKLRPKLASTQMNDA